MIQNGYLNFFNINECGMYRYGGSVNQGCDIATSFDLIKNWIESREFNDTIPWDPKQKTKTNCYCHEVHKDLETGDYLLVLWKSEAQSSGPLLGISIDANGKKQNVIKQSQGTEGKPVIWGSACYYWVIPEVNCVVSIKFENSKCDSAMFQDWVAGCINHRIDVPGTRKVETEKKVTRISFTDEHGEECKLLYKFDLSLKSLDTSSAKLGELSKKVTHIIRRETVSLKVVDARAEWVKIFAGLGVPYASHRDNKRKRDVEIKVEAKPTSAEIKDIIEKYSKETKPGSWSNVGFLTDTGIAWANSYRLTENLSIEDNGESILDAETLYKTVKANRDRYLSPIKRDLMKAQKTGS